MKECFLKGDWMKTAPDQLSTTAPPTKCLHNTTYRADFRPVCPVVVIQPFQQTTAYTTINISYRLRINHATDRIKAKSGKAPQDAEINTENTVGAELPYRLGTSSPKERHIYHHIGAGDVLDHSQFTSYCKQDSLSATATNANNRNRRIPMNEESIPTILHLSPSPNTRPAHP